MCRLGGRGAGAPSPRSYKVSVATLKQSAGAQMPNTSASIKYFLLCVGSRGLYLMGLIPI